MFSILITLCVKYKPNFLRSSIVTAQIQATTPRYHERTQTKFTRRTEQNTRFLHGIEVGFSQLV